MRSLSCILILASFVQLDVQQSPPSVASLLSPPLDEGAARLQAAQQLAMSAYPELRTRGWQMQLTAGDSEGVTVSFAFAEADSDKVMSVSRLRPAELVVEAKFDLAKNVRSASMRGPLARTQERRVLRSSPSGWSQALELPGVDFPPSKGAELMSTINRELLRGVIGRLTPTAAKFRQGTSEEALYWEIMATTENGELVTLKFEPIKGRLIEFIRGGQK